MFDPGFAGYRARGKEDAGAADGGADPLGVLDRWVALRHVLWLLARCFGTDTCGPDNARSMCIQTGVTEHALDLHLAASEAQLAPLA